MRRIQFACLAIFALSTIATAESQPEAHDGFYLAFGYGFGAGNLGTELKANGSSSDMTTSGLNNSFDFRIGGAIAEDLILHATLLGDGMSDPKTEYEGEKETVFKTAGMSLLGIGLTKYIMPANAFLGGSVGFSQFSLQPKNSSELKKIDAMGFGFQLKAGKEWWVSANWGLGVALDFEWGTVTPDDYTLGMTKVSETDNYRNVGVQFSATFQ